MRHVGWIIASVAVSGLASVAASQAVDDPLTRPIAADYAARWITPQPPKRIYGNTYLVGFRKMNVALIDSGAGLIMIDSALPQSVAAVEANIRALGFKLSDVKLILSTEPHYDHAGGLAALAREHVQDIEMMMAGAVITVAPVLILFLALQRYYIRGMLAGSVKG